MSARRLAYEALLRIDHHGAYANLVLPAMLRRSGLDDRDRRFATELVYGTTRMRRACDAVVDRFVESEPSPELRTLLRLGAYQLTFADVAAHAAVGETVGLAGRGGRGFVNAVLRNTVRTPMVWPDEATRLSYPEWLATRLHAELGDADALLAMERMNVAAVVTERADGYVQDLSSQWVVDAVAAERHDLVLDVCAAPGGKATGIAAGGAFVVATDIAPARAGLIVSNANGLGGSVTSSLATVIADATKPPFRSGSVDRVLVDAPCSGLGALRRRPDARWRITEAAIDDLAALQRDLLATSAELVRPGGRLVYSVCTLTAAESIDHPVPDGLVVDNEPPPGQWHPYAHGFRVLPHDGDTDGMVIIRYRRC